RYEGGRAFVRAHRLSRSRQAHCPGHCGRAKKTGLISDGRRRFHQGDRSVANCPRTGRKGMITARRQIITPGRQMMAFVFRDFSLTKRYFGWVVVFTFYAMVNSATIALIGVAAKDEQLTLTLIVGVLLWSFLSVLFNEIASSVAYERWEGTLEYTFMAPVSRLIHLFCLSLFA